MALPGDATNHTPLVRTDYSSIDIRKFVVDPSELNKTAVFPASSSTTGFSVNITRALTAKPNKMKNLHRRKRANEVMATIPQATAIGPVKSRPRYLDLFEAVTMREPRSQPFASSYCIETLNSGSGSGHERSNTGGGRGTESPGLGSEQVHRHMGYNEYLAQAFGFSRESTEKSTPEQEKLMKAGPSSLSGQSDTSTASMEVCFRMSAKEPLQMSAKERRPKIQLTIPRTRSHTYSVMPYQTSKERPSTRRHDTPNSVSPPSTTRQKIDSELPARLSIVSPLSVVEMPRPRRPFSKFSFEDITKTMSDSTPLLSKSASSDSSDMDDRSSNYSSRSSVSSLNSDSAVKPTEITRGSVAFSIMSPTAAGVFDSMPLTPPYPKHPRAMRSTTFLADKVTSFLADKVNRNKPLPPEPGAEPIRPLAFSRTSSMRSRGKAPPPLLVTRQSSVNLPRSRESQGMSLRSKYTPADLDALDDAFQRSSPPYLQPPIYTCQKSPTLSQAEMALEAHLGTINEDAPMNYDLLSLMHDPLQISRGPMQMEPSRKPPSLPQSQVSGEGSLDPRKKLQKKPSTHVVLQMRVGSQNSRKRISASLIGSSTKAHKILGRSCTGAPMERDGSTDAHWSSSESRRVSTNMSAEDSDSPESDVSSIQDAAFEEVRQRLELLSPKDDASQTFLAFHESIRVGESSVSHDVQKQDCSYPPTKIPQPSVSIPERHVFPRAKEPLEDPVLNQTPQGPPIEITTTSEDDIHPLHRRRRCDEMSVRSLGSIAVSEIPDIYASLPSPESPRQQSMTEDEVERMISADAAEQVLLRILENLDNLQDLFNTAHVSRGFYRTFKRHELPLMKNALFSMSPAAWELREMSPPYPGLEGIDNASPKLGYTPSLYLQHYMRDMYIMIALKSMILVHCKSFLRADTITALAGGETDRASQIDDAFCRVWTFCRLFGCGTNREDDIVGQMDWLRGGTLARQQRRKTSTVDMGADLDMDSITINAPVGFGKGNIGGLTAEDLYDMTEIWTCLGVLVRGLQGKRKEARDYGVFEKSNITPGNFEQEDGILEEWTYHLLTLAPPVVLDVTSPTSPTEATFAHARSRGYTNWSPPSLGASRSTFLKEAVSRVYQEKMLQRHPTISVISAPNYSSSTPSPLLEEILITRQRIKAHGAEIRAKRNDPAFKALLPSEERPMSNFPDVISKLENSPDVNDSPLTATPSSLSSSSCVYSSTSPLTTPSSTPVMIQPISVSLSGKEKEFIANFNVSLEPQVRDPVDVAVDRLVAMGFDEKKSKKALADTDSGNNIDFNKAAEALVRERNHDGSNLMNWNYRGAIQTEASPREAEQSWSPTLGSGLGIAGVPRYS